MKKSCVDCFHCKTTLLLPDLTDIPPELHFHYLTLSKIKFGRVRCTKGKWFVDSGEEFIYNEFNYAVSNPESKRMRLAEECKEYCV